MGVELRKMFNTRSGFWMLMSIGILSVIATGAVILFAPNDEVTYGNFAGAIGIPMSIVLPMIAVLSITSEWSQRTGLTTFTLVPSRSKVVLAKLLDTVLVGAASIAIALGIGVLGNIVGSNLAGVDTVWDFGASEMLYVLGGNVLGLLMGFTLGVLFRNSAAAIVGYFVYAMVIPTLSGLLAGAQEWYRDAQQLGGLPVQPGRPVRRRLHGHRLGPARRHRHRVAAHPPRLRALAGAAVRGEVAPPHN